MHDYLLAHDIGTSGDKAVLFDATNLQIVGSITSSYETYYVGDGGVEHDPDNWWKAVCSSTKKLLENTGIQASAINGVSFSAIMNSCLPIDSNGSPLHRALIWSDQRGKGSLGELFSFASEDTFYRKTGHRINGTYAVAKMLWFKKNRPELFQKTAFFVQAKDYIVYKLTGSIATDYSDASHLGVIDRVSSSYWKELLDYIKIPVSMFPELHVSTDIVGRVTKQASFETGLLEGTPVIIGGGDGCCATAGAGVFKPGLAYNSLGTSSWNGELTKTMNLSKDKVTFSFIYLDGKQTNTVGTMQSAGHSVEWVLNTLYPDEYKRNKSELFQRMNSAILKNLSVPKKNKIIYLPYLLGERSPWWNSNARGCFIGLNASTNGMDLVMACLEGVAFNLKIILDDMEKTNGLIENMRIIGGGARNEAWLSIIASVFDKTLSIPRYASEATSLGAILCAGIGSDVFKGFSTIEIINPTERIIVPNPILVDHYKKLYSVFKKSYSSLTGVFEELRSDL